ncbi:hypothetical protein V8J88_02035 [Massilia sp. W12]|uniref:hypothetical protein n=1 Tax=Massilia sp. W12 TaxID=3126507 RepID=UPI0030D02139
MKIIVKDIEYDDVEYIGCAGLPSYPVCFKAKHFEGWARFVPFSENLEKYIDEQVGVEVACEKVTDFSVGEFLNEKIENLPEKYCYAVCGRVTEIAHHSQPVGNKTIYITSHDAEFSLSWLDIGDCDIKKGDIVTFNIHGLSLWDEMI